MPPGGYFGRALVADATDGTSRILPLPDDVLPSYLGGAGLGTWLLHQPAARAAVVAASIRPLPVRRHRPRRLLGQGGGPPHPLTISGAGGTRVSTAHTPDGVGPQAHIQDS